MPISVDAPKELPGQRAPTQGSTLRRPRRLAYRNSKLTNSLADREFVAHYHADRPHQGLGNELIDGAPSTGKGDIVETERLGGLLRSYHRAA